MVLKGDMSRWGRWGGGGGGGGCLPGVASNGPDEFPLQFAEVTPIILWESEPEFCVYGGCPLAVWCLLIARVDIRRREYQWWKVT